MRVFVAKQRKNNPAMVRAVQGLLRGQRFLRLARRKGGSVATMADGHAIWLRFPDRGLPQPVADLGQLGDCKEGTPLWGSLSGRNGSSGSDSRR